MRIVSIDDLTTEEHEELDFCFHLESDQERDQIVRDFEDYFCMSSPRAELVVVPFRDGKQSLYINCNDPDSYVRALTFLNGYRLGLLNAKKNR